HGCRGYVQRAQVGAAECEAGDVLHRHSHLLDDAPVRRVARDAPAVVMRIPHETLGVHCEPVRKPDLELGEQAAVVHRSGSEIDLEAVNAAHPRIAQVHRAIVRAPRDPVAARHATDNQMSAAIGIEAIHGTGWLPIVGEILGSGPEAPDAVNFAVVEAVARDMGFWVDNRWEMAARGVQEDEATVRGRDQTANTTQPDGAGGIGYRPARSRLGTRGEAANAPALHVRPVKRLLAHAPHRALADQVRRCDRDAQAGDGCGPALAQRWRSNKD